MCRLFEFRGIIYAHSLCVFIERSIYEVPNKYIIPRWRKDVEREYTCIPTTYTIFGAALNPKLHDNYHKTLDEILELTTNDDGKHEVIQLGLIEIKDRVRPVQSSSTSNLPCTNTVPTSTSTLPPSHTSPKSSFARNTIKESITRKVLYPLVARRRGHPCMKRKVNKVDTIVMRLKRNNKKATPVQGHKVCQGKPRKLNFPCTGGVQHTMDEPGLQNQSYYFPSMDGTQDNIYIPVPQDEPYYFPCMDGIQDSMHGLAQYKWRTILEAYLILNQEWSTI
ncbi:uncharacterized protein LOC114264558 isoform X3 [Camellia sinensis]|uniref:uncharacterized protein LOC114264558 isoform X3 n=1 Tax=Camellia sinensis TaxID=4442 RepID=UPI0010364230|nr:uncharacterized protein LOC114264558 isoform X3 [Camellia sinensis]